MTNCEDYDTKWNAGNSITNDDLEDFFVSSLWGEVNLKTVCEENPCALGAGYGGQIQTACKYSRESESTGFGGKDDCIAGEGKLKTAVDGCVGKTCDAGTQCVTDASGNPFCVSCQQLVDNNKLGKDGSPIVPEPNMCSKFPDCYYTKESAMTSNAINSFGSCAYVPIDCNKIDDCTDYDNVQAYNAVQSGVDLEDTNVAKTKQLLKFFCAKNPCVKKIGHACVYDGGSDCENP